ncbi:MAG: FAD-dependent oxidoreductase [Limnochordales bacterium]|nr:FAD-dependent oxidoreductase [Limnochordales bacterium]
MDNKATIASLTVNFGDGTTDNGSSSGDDSSRQHYDVAIIGGGPAGLSAALYTARAGLRTVILDKSPYAGALGLTDKIENYPGVPGPISGIELLRIFREQALSFGAVYLQETVLSVDPTSDPKEVITTRQTLYADRLIVASGAMGRKASLPGEERLLGRGVSYCATCDGAFFTDQPVAVVGDTEEAVEEALFLTRFARPVHFLARGSTLRAPGELVAELKSHPRVVWREKVRILEIVGDKRVEGVRIASPASRGQEEFLPVKGVFIYLQGNRPILDFFQGTALPALTADGCVRVNEEYETSLPGVFAVGDLTCKKVRQAVLAAADGVLAALAVERQLRGRAKIRSMW